MASYKNNLGGTYVPSFSFMLYNISVDVKYMKKFLLLCTIK